MYFPFLSTASAWKVWNKIQSVNLIENKYFPDNIIFYFNIYQNYLIGSIIFKLSFLKKIHEVIFGGPWHQKGYIWWHISYPNPNCLQTTSASISSHWSSQIVPHLPLWYTSTRPSKSSRPPTSLRGAPLPKQNISFIPIIHLLQQRMIRTK